MTMTTTQAIITIAAVVLGTMATRFIPFMIFPEGKNPPEFVQYLGTVLPYAAIGLLIIYCLKDVPSSSTHGLPEAIAIIFIVLLHKWKKSTLLSIGGGTILYMILVQTVSIRKKGDVDNTAFRHPLPGYSYSAISLIASTVLSYCSFTHHTMFHIR